MAQSCRSFDTRQSPPFVNEDRDGDEDDDVEDGIIIIIHSITSMIHSIVVSDVFFNPLIFNPFSMFLLNRHSAVYY